MAMDVIDAVRKAELQADQTEKKSAVHREEIIRKAREDALAAVEQAANDEQEKADRMLRDARRQCEEILKKSELETGEEVSRLRETVQSKQAGAYRLIVSELT